MKVLFKFAIASCAFVAACGNDGVRSNNIKAEKPDVKQAARDTKPPVDAFSTIKCDSTKFGHLQRDEEAPKASGASSYWAGYPPTFPRTAVPHVVTYRYWRGFGDKSGDVVKIARRGALLKREKIYVGSHRSGEAAHTIQFSNFATGGNVATTISNGRHITSAEFGFPAKPRESWQHFELSRAGTERIAGSLCRVVFARPVGEEGVTYSACVTNDGVVLRDTVHYRDKEIMEESIATKVERRAIAETEVLPSRNLLDWAYWNNSPKRQDPILTKLRNYTLTLSQTDAKRGLLKVKTYKADSESFSEATCFKGNVEDIFLASPSTQMSFISGRSLTISGRGEHTPLGNIDRFKEEPLDKPPAQILGGTCNWIDAAVNVADYSRLVCRSTDGLPMMIQEGGWGQEKPGWMAVALERNRNSSDSIKPPATITNWAYWGWPQLKSSR
jgi:hypothetical protein